MCHSLSFLPSRTLLTQIISFVSLLYMLEIFHLQNVLLQSSTNDYTTPSFLLPALTLLARTTLLRLIKARTLSL